jgi:hypothetical protein
MYQGEVREMSKREYEEQKNRISRERLDACDVARGPMLGTGCPPRPPEVAEALEGLRMVIQRYDALVGNLGGRLYSVLRPAEPQVAEGCAEKGYQTDLAREINGIRCLARDVSDALESIIERVEV